MRIVLPFSFIYFYTVKNGRFFWGKFKFINLLFYFSVKINPQFGIFSRIVILYL